MKIIFFGRDALLIHKILHSKSYTCWRIKAKWAIKEMLAFGFRPRPGHSSVFSICIVNPNSSGIFSGISAVAWCAKKHTTECALKYNAKTDLIVFFG